MRSEFIFKHKTAFGQKSGMEVVSALFFLQHIAITIINLWISVEIAREMFFDVCCLTKIFFFVVACAFANCA